VPDKEFSLEKFDDWFETHKLYNKLNPNLGFGRAGHSPTFKGCVRSGYTPGIDYFSNNMYAAAAGSFIDYAQIGMTGRPRGDYLKIACPVGADNFRYAFMITYAHLSVRKNEQQEVKRNDLVASVEYTDIAKLILQRRGNYVDPDNYGINHSYMGYWDGKTNLEIGDEMYDKEKKQFKIISDISYYTTDPRLNLKSSLFRRQHRPVKENKMCAWDAPEIMRYYDELFQARPQYFPKLSLQKFGELKQEFYANQPIILTLPLKP
jgi:hypothetical protein